MKAAVVTSFDKAPEYGDFREPVTEPGEVLVKVSAAALSRLVRGQASGHITAATAVFRSSRVWMVWAGCLMEGEFILRFPRHRGARWRS